MHVHDSILDFPRTNEDYVFFSPFFLLPRTSRAANRRKILRNFLANVRAFLREDATFERRRGFRYFTSIPSSRIIELENYLPGTGRVVRVISGERRSVVRVYNGIQKAHPTAELN